MIAPGACGGQARGHFRRVNGTLAGPGDRGQVFENTVQVQRVGKCEAVRQQVQLEVRLGRGIDIAVGLESHGRQWLVNFRKHAVGHRPGGLSVGVEGVSNQGRVFGTGTFMVANPPCRFGSVARWLSEG